MKYGSKYGHKGMSGAYGKTKAVKGKNPLKGSKMARGPKDPKPSHKGYAM